MCVCGGAGTGCVTCREALGGEGLSAGRGKNGEGAGREGCRAQKSRAETEQSRSGGEAGVWAGVAVCGLGLGGGFPSPGAWSSVLS